MSNEHLGELDELVLLTIGILQAEGAYGYLIKETLQKQIGRTVSLPTIHSVLYRLEHRGFVRSHMGGATQERGGRRKRLFSITDAGQTALHTARSTREHLWHLWQGLFPA